MGTSAAQTVLLNDALPLTDETDLHKNILLECISDIFYQPLGLYRICLK